MVCCPKQETAAKIKRMDSIFFMVYVLFIPTKVTDDF
jgi:hypothetical protein